MCVVESQMKVRATQPRIFSGSQGKETYPARQKLGPMSVYEN